MRTQPSSYFRNCRLAVASVPLRFCVFVTILALLSLPAVCQVQKDPVAMDILRHAVSINMQVPSTVVLSGSLWQQRAVDTAQGTITVEIGAADKHRLDMNMPGSTASHVINGMQQLRIMNGTRSNVPRHAALNSHSDWFPLFSEIVDCESPGYRVQYLGTENYQGSTVHHIHIEKVQLAANQRIAALLSSLAGADLFFDFPDLPLSQTHTQGRLSADGYSNA